jgi:hypothetical protein
MASTFEILLLLNSRYTGQGSIGLLVRDVQQAAVSVTRLGTAFQSTSKLAQAAATAQNQLVVANRAAAVVQQALATNTNTTATQMLAYQQIVRDQQVAQADAAGAAAALDAKMGGLAGTLGGLATAAAVAGVVALGMAIKSAVEDANNFNEALSKVQANTGATTASMAQLGQAALNLGASGQTPFNASVLAAGTLVPLSHQIPARTVAAALPIYSQLAQVLRLPDLTEAASAVGALQATYGAGGARGATKASLAAYANMVAAAEQFGGVTNPGQIASTVGRFAGPSRVAGITAPEALTFVAAQTLAGLPALRATQNLTTLESALFIKPTATAQKMAARLGIGIGPGAAVAAGGLFPYLQQLYARTVGVDPRKGGQVLAQILGQKNALAGLSLVASTVGFPGLEAQTQRTATAERRGVLRAAFNVSQQSPVQQWAEVQARLHTDLTTFGTVITRHFEPPALQLAGAMLKSAEDFATMLGQGGNRIGNALAEVQRSSVARTLGRGVGEAAGAGTPLGRAAQTTTSDARLLLLGGPVGLAAFTAKTVWDAVGGIAGSGAGRAVAGVLHALTSNLANPPGAYTNSQAARDAYDAMLVARNRAAFGPQLPPGLSSSAILARRQAAMAGPIAAEARRTSPLPPGLSSSAIESRRLSRMQQAYDRQAAARDRQAAASRLAAAAALLPGGSTTATRAAARRTARVGPELIRQTGQDYYDRYALFTEARAAYGGSAVRLVGGQAGAQQEALRKADQQIAQMREMIGSLENIVRTLLSGNAMTRQELAYWQQLIGTVNRPAAASPTSPPTPRRTIGAAVR